MMRRRRRASTSSVETVDENQVRWRQEASVVRTMPKDQSADEWPIFELRDAVVLNKDGITPESALVVETKGPYMVRGHLVVDDPSQKSHLIMKVRTSIPIEIRNCINYSIGESDEGSPLIWILGRGAWYEINPSVAYSPIYNKMCEATSIYYKIMDIYSGATPKKAKKGKSSDLMSELSPIFLSYATRVGDGSTLEEVTRRCSEHAPFFISQFAQEDPNIFNWQATAFYKWLVKEHPDVVKAAQDAKNNPRKIILEPEQTDSPKTRGRATSRSATKSTDIEEIDARDFALSQRDNPPPQQPKQPKKAKGPSPAVRAAPVPQAAGPIPFASLDDDVTSTAIDIFGQCCEAGAKSRKGLTVQGLLNELYFRYRFPTYKDGSRASHKIPPREYIHYNAQALLQAVDKSKYESTEVHGWLKELASEPFIPVAYKPSDFPLRVVPRESRPWMARKTDNTRPPVEETNTFLDDTGESDGPQRIGKGVKGLGRRPGKSSLRLATSKKRPRSEVESNSESEEPSGAKKSHYFSDGDDAMNDVDTSLNGDSSFNDDLVQIVLRADKVPSTVPKGPNDTWTCDQDECDYVVRGSDEENCQARIHDHFAQHEEHMTRVNLAVTESRGQLPINHLLEKIKKLGEKSQNAQQNPVEGLQAREPIKRNLIV